LLAEIVICDWQGADNDAGRLARNFGALETRTGLLRTQRNLCFSVCAFWAGGFLAAGLWPRPRGLPARAWMPAPDAYQRGHPRLRGHARTRLSAGAGVCRRRRERLSAARDALRGGARRMRAERPARPARSRVAAYRSNIYNLKVQSYEIQPVELDVCPGPAIHRGYTPSYMPKSRLCVSRQIWHVLRDPPPVHMRPSRHRCVSARFLSSINLSSTRRQPSLTLLLASKST